MRPADPPATRARLLDAAGVLFAERGFRGATLRAIAERAGVNLAAANYHFGSKERLYLEVARRQFERVERRLTARGAGLDEELDSLSREEIVSLLRTRVQTVLESVLEQGGIHGPLMQRELSDPSQALPVIVSSYIEPQRRAMERMVARLAPGLPKAEVERCARSIVGQAMFYLTHRPALLLLMERTGYSKRFLAEVARHVTEFSLGGIERLAAARSQS